VAHSFVDSSSPSDWPTALSQGENRRGSREAESEANAPQSEQNGKEQEKEIEQRTSVPKPPFSRGDSEREI
jgi:hypothetical protein